MEENKDYQSSMEYSYGGGNATVQAPVKENVFLGAVGALAGTLIGVICIVIHRTAWLRFGIVRCGYGSMCLARLSDAWKNSE